MSGRGLPRRGVLAAGLGGGVLAAARPAAAAELLTFEGLYKRFDVLGLAYSDRVTGLTGRGVMIQGYMAPPLRAESNFFVLTREPLAICPFCQSDADWPLDTVVVYLRGASPLVRAGTRVSVSGRLETGSRTDPETGFVSQLRLADASYHAA